MISKLMIAVGAHPDDIELGCGGTLCCAVKSGIRVIAIYLTKGERSGDGDSRVDESKQALDVLGVKEVYFGDFPDTEIPSTRKVIDFLEQFYTGNEPDIVFTHSINDIHQDHRQTGWHSWSAFRNVPRILAYETPRVTPSFNPTYFVDISDCIEIKAKALKCHISQCKRRYMTYESMVNLASFRGRQVGVNAAEAYEVLRYVEYF